MRRFAKRLILFVFILGILLVVSYNGNKILFDKFGFQVPSDVETLITGSSLATGGINPDYIEKSCNVGLAGEPAVVSFVKIRDLLSRPNNVDRIILSFSLVETSSYWDLVFSENKTNGVEIFSRISFLREENGLDLFEGIPVNYFAYSEVYLRNRIFPVIPYLINVFKKEEKIYPHIGGYTNVEFNRREVEERVDNRQEILNKMFLHDSFPENISKMNFNYLDSIVALTDRMNVDLILVGMPMENSLFEMIPSTNRIYYLEQVEMRLKQPHVSFINLTNYFNSPDFFGDYVHINRVGADSIAKVLEGYIVETKN
ncbi:hypothetical protein [Marinilabilia salmonicolor]|uniref:hypothetical protein n=1 Tax=Marinilabilia salmonicolor TaxID=989 RepID=UPI00029AA378|nr:hypothetical protein [Marinilabilia salmonicolor]